MHFGVARFFGGTEVDQVLDAMEFAVYQLGVQHVIIDNLQFMLSSTLSPTYAGGTVSSGASRGCSELRLLES